MTVSKMSVLVIILVGIFIGYRLWQSPDAGIDPVSPERVAPPPDSFSAAAELDDAPETEEEEVSLRALDEPGCLTESQFEALPEVRQDSARLKSVSSVGDALIAYENLDEESIQSFATQGDSAAMVVLGAISVMRAYGKDDSQAIAWLNGGQFIPDIVGGANELSGEASLALNDAAYWFYEAASHGRLMALQQYGQVKGRLFGGPVGLGWVDQAEFDALTIAERNALNPNNLFGQVSYDIAPDLRDGAVGGILSSMLPTSSKQIEIRERLLDEFNQSLDDRNLPRVEVAPAATTNLEELFDRVCESVKHKELQRLSLEE